MNVYYYKRLSNKGGGLMEVIFRSRDLMDKIIDYVKENEKVTEILFYGFLNKDMLKILNDYIITRNTPISFKFIIPKIHYYKTALQFIKHNNMESICEVRTNPKCIGTFIIIDNTFAFFSGLRNKEEEIQLNNLILLKYDDGEASEALRKIFIRNWGSSYSIHL